MARTAVGTYRAYGAEAASARWTLEGDDSGDFSLSSNSGATTMLEFRNPPDYEAPADADTDNVYEVTVVAGDGTDSDTLDVSVTVTDMVEVVSAIVQRYDTDPDGRIDINEVIVAIEDYQAGNIDINEVIAVIEAYQSS